MYEVRLAYPEQPAKRDGTGETKLKGGGRRRMLDPTVPVHAQRKFLVFFRGLLHNVIMSSQ